MGGGWSCDRILKTRTNYREYKVGMGRIWSVAMASATTAAG